MKHIFIINARVGKTGFATKIKEELASVEGLDYYVFHTRRAGDEKNLVKMILDFFEGEKLRFYACGGSGTMRNMLNGFDNLENVEVAFYPCGLTCDFMKTFGDDQIYFKDLRKLIDGKVIQVDYLKSTSGVMLNTFSVGLDTMKAIQTIENMRYLKVFHENIPYFIGTVLAIFSPRKDKYIIDTENLHYEGKLTELFFGNGCVLGGNLNFFESADTTDGLAQIRIVLPKPSITCIPYILSLKMKKYNMIDKGSKCTMSSYMTIRRADGGEILVDQDGELIGGVTDWRIEVIHKGLNLVVPKEVKL